MRVSRIVLSNFMLHQNTDVALPDRGVVLLVGDNGAGKSTLIEGVSVAAFGVTLRGSKPWTAQSGLASVDAEDMLIARARTGSHTGLTFHAPGVSPLVYETTKKAQAALETALGTTHARWARSHVFRAHDVGRFARAGDAERKRLLESLLGLDALDEAATRALVAKSSARTSLSVAEGRAAASVQALVRVETSLQTERQRVFSTPKTPLQKLEQQLEGAVAAEALAGEKYKEVFKHWQSLRSTPVPKAPPTHCYACGQSLPAVDQVVFDREAAERRAQQLVEAEKAHSQAFGARGDAARAVQTLRSAVREEKTLVAAREKHGAVVDTLETSALETFDTLSELEAQVAAQKTEASYAEAAVEVLGPRGARAQLLSGALVAVEAVANSWLTRLSDGRFSLRLESQTATASGTRDAISLRVVGLGHDEDYDGASSGEQRRIDIALLFALAEIAAGAAGKPPGTLFCDEIFDALDAEGTALAAEVLADVARDRCVVVVSHSPALRAAFGTGAHIWTVRQGSITT